MDPEEERQLLLAELEDQKRLESKKGFNEQ